MAAAAAVIGPAGAVEPAIEPAGAADAVTEPTGAAALVARGVPREMIDPKGFGYFQPVVATGPGVLEHRNRRLEITLQCDLLGGPQSAQR